MIPETKGLSLEQIDLLYRESTIIGSNKYRERMLTHNQTFTTHIGDIPGVEGALHSSLSTGLSYRTRGSEVTYEDKAGR